MKKTYFNSGVQICTLVFVAINTIYIIPMFILLALAHNHNPLELELAREYFISFLLYIGLRLMFFSIAFDVLFVALYISQFIRTRKRGIFIFSLIAAISNILINAVCFLLIPMTAVFH